MFALTCLALLAVAFLLTAAHAQAPQAPPQSQQPPQPQPQWDAMPRMQLERLYGGPLRDTIVQRWRDPADGTVCYLYIPITAQHSQPTATGYVQYGPNAIGSISCVPGSVKPAVTPPRAAPRPAPKKPAPPAPPAEKPEGAQE